MVMNSEENVASLEQEIMVLNSKLEECRQVVQETTGVFRDSGIADMRHEIELISIQINVRALNVLKFRPTKWNYILGPFFEEVILEQFFPKNVEYNARGALRKLEHTTFVRDYVKALSVLMLDIRDMTEKNKLFTFGRA
ncbi:UNVERIFIED_CONTAM: hypothetical protein Scaly_2014500 [Sesamum calycinum]|uniref:Retrotransposon gag domain-containing protein n=1 Tax=Sesamum calycinum TaxID=2727403 RepID=A0AAW2N111_9LAMI